MGTTLDSLGFGFESMNGHMNSMIHSKHRIADQLVFSTDVSYTLSTIVEQLIRYESEETQVSQSRYR